MKKIIPNIFVSLICFMFVLSPVSAESISVDSHVTFTESIRSKSVEFANYTSVNFSLVSNYDGQRDGTAYKTYDSGITRFYYSSAVRGSRASSMSATIEDFSDYSNFYVYDSIVITGGGSTTLNLPSGLDITDFSVGFDIVSVDSQESTTNENSGFISISKNSNGFTINYNVPSRGGYYLFGYTIVPYLYYNADTPVDPEPTPPVVNSFTISGSVNPSNAGIINGLGTYEEGTTATLTAIANEGYTFANWSNGATTQTIDIIVTSDIDLVANFQSNPTSNGQVLRITTFSNPQTYTNSNGIETFVYDVTYTYYGAKLDVYYQNALVQTGVDTFSYSFTGRPYSNFPNVPHYDIAESFSIDNYVVRTSTSSNGIVVTNPNTDNLISNGNALTQGSKNDLDVIDGQFNSSYDRYQSLEQGLIEDYNNNLDDIDLDTYKITNNLDLINTANFVRTQFDRLTLNNPFGLVLGFSLCVGLALLLIGKRL